jgi:hypothetical protein
MRPWAGEQSSLPNIAVLDISLNRRQQGSKVFIVLFGIYGKFFFKYRFLEKRGRLLFESVRINMKKIIMRSYNC